MKIYLLISGIVLGVLWVHDRARRAESMDEYLLREQLVAARQRRKARARAERIINV